MTSCEPITSASPATGRAHPQGAGAGPIAAPASTSNSPVVLLAVAVTMTLWASAFIVTRVIGATFAPGALALGRVALASVALGVVVLVRRARGGSLVLPRGRAAVLVALYGAAWFGYYTVLFNAAERHLDAGTTALLVNTSPLMVAVLAGLVLREGISRQHLAGLAVAFVGVAAIAWSTSSGAQGAHDVIGVLFALGAAGLYALGVVVQKVALRSVDSVTATWLGSVAGTVALLPFAGDLLGQLRTAPPTAIAGVAYLGLLCTGVAFTTWAYALSRSDAATLSASSYAVPAITIALSWLLLSEAPAPLALTGGVLALAGVAVTRWRPRRRTAGKAESVISEHQVGEGRNLLR